MLTRCGPKAFRWFDEDILEEASVPIAEELRTDKGEDGNTSVLMDTCEDCTPPLQEEELSNHLIIIIH